MSVERAVTDVDALMASLEVSVRPGVFTFVTGHRAELDAVAAVRIDEAEGPTLVVEVDAALQAGVPVGFEAGWITLEVHSALSAVGLTARVSSLLAEIGVPCNVLAGFHHDHLLVPIERVDDAVEALRRRTGAAGTGCVS